MFDPRLDWRLPAGKEMRIREAFPDALPTLWWFHLPRHGRPRPPSDEELAALREEFKRRAAVLHVTADVFRSTALPGNPYVVAFTCAPPSEICVEIPVGEQVWTLYLAQSSALSEAQVNFVTEFGEADNPFRHASPPPGT